MLTLKLAVAVPAKCKIVALVIESRGIPVSGKTDAITVGMRAGGQGSERLVRRRSVGPDSQSR